MLNQTPSAFRQLIQAEGDAEVSQELALRLVIFGGEALEFGSLDRGLSATVTMNRSWSTCTASRRRRCM